MAIRSTTAATAFYYFMCSVGATADVVSAPLQDRRSQGSVGRFRPAGEVAAAYLAQSAHYPAWRFRLLPPENAQPVRPA
jgi:hypothetical protein